MNEGSDPGEGLLPRHLEHELTEALRSSRVVNIVGPRQVGKTTLVRDLFGGGHFLTLDDRGVQAAIERDPVGQLEFLTKQAGDAPLIIDEAQRSRALALAVKKIVDERRRMGQFILTGSSNIFTTADVADSLAGRVRTLTMLPLSAGEIHRVAPARLLDWASGKLEGRSSPTLGSLPIPAACSRDHYLDLIIRGGYPEIRPLDTRPRVRRLRSYIDTIVDRDVADLLKVRKTDALRRLVDQIAVRTGQELNVSELCNLVGINRATADQYLDVLTRLALMIRLGAWTSGEGRREVRHPKAHLIDTGLVAALRNLTSASFGAREAPAALGGIMESFVHAELLKNLPYQDDEWRLYHWRRGQGREVDIVAEAGRRLVLDRGQGLDDDRRWRLSASQMVLRGGAGQELERDGDRRLSGRESSCLRRGHVRASALDLLGLPEGRGRRSGASAIRAAEAARQRATHELRDTARRQLRARAWPRARRSTGRTRRRVAYCALVNSKRKEPEMSLAGVRAMVFDVFGTVVDWRSGVAREAAPFLRRHGVAGADPAAFADAWRRRYQPAMEEVRSGRRPFTRLDVLHRENLGAILPDFGIDARGVPAAELDELTLAWHRLDPWPDAVAGLTALKARTIIAPLSNGNIILMLDMAKRAGLPWDAILGAEVVQAFKPTRESYLRTADVLAMRPEEVCLVAAHNSDLAGARACGLKTAFVARPTEHGAGQTTDLRPEQDWDAVAEDFVALADLCPASFGRAR